MSAPRVLVADGNVVDVRRKRAASAGYDAGTGHARVLRRIRPAIECDVLYPAHGHARAQPANRLVAQVLPRVRSR